MATQVTPRVALFAWLGLQPDGGVDTVPPAPPATPPPLPAPAAVANADEFHGLAVALAQLLAQIDLLVRARQERAERGGTPAR
jgi:hypothetical protein